MGLKLQHDLTVVRNDKLKNILHNDEKNAVRTTTTPSTNNGVHITTNSVYEPTSNHAAHTTNTLSMNTSTTGSETINPHNVHRKDRRTRSQKKNTTSPDQEELSLISLLYNSPTPRLKYCHEEFPLSPPLSASTGRKCRWTSINLHVVCALLILSANK